MTNIAYRLLLTITATSLLLIIFVVQKAYTLSDIFNECAYLAELPNAISYAVYLLIPITLTLFSILLSKFLGKDEFKAGKTVIEYANTSFIPNYFGSEKRLSNSIQAMD